MRAKLSTLGLLAGVGILLPGTQADAQSQSVIIQRADPEDTTRTRERNGVRVLRATDEEMTNEHANCDWGRSGDGLCIAMSTARLDTPRGPQHGTGT